MATRNEARAILYEKLVQLETRPGESLAAFVEHPRLEEVVAPSGTKVMVTIVAFWDTTPGDSDLYVEVTVRPASVLLPRPCKSGLVVDPYTGNVERYSNFPSAS